MCIRTGSSDSKWNQQKYFKFHCRRWVKPKLPEGHLVVLFSRRLNIGTLVSKGEGRDAQDAAFVVQSHVLYLHTTKIINIKKCNGIYQRCKLPHKTINTVLTGQVNMQLNCRVTALTPIKS